MIWRRFQYEFKSKNYNYVYKKLKNPFNYNYVYRNWKFWLNYNCVYSCHEYKKELSLLDSLISQ